MIYLYNYDDTTYQIDLERKKGRCYVYYRLDLDNKLLKVTMPYFASNKDILEMAKKRLPKLIELSKKSKELDEAEAHYYLGEKKIEVVDLNKIKGDCLQIIKERVSYYSSLMGISNPYKVKIRDMKTRLGTNSRRTHTLDFALVLFRYPVEVIDSIVIHELAHHFYFDHSKNFYAVVYKYMDKATYKYCLRLIRERKYDRSYILEGK